MLVRLRPGALGRVDHEQEEVDPARPRDHVANEPLVARHVDQRQPRPVGQIERRVPEVDRDPALLLLGQPVRVLTGQRPDEPGLPVVDVARCADRQRHRAWISSCSMLVGSKPFSSSSSRHWRLVALAPGEEREHQQVEPLAPARLVALGDDRLEQDQARVGRRAGADRPQDRGRALVVPVVEDRRQEVDVALRHALEEAPLDEPDPVAERRLVAHGLGEIEDDSAQARLPLEQRRQQGPVAATDVDHGLAIAPVDPVEPLHSLLLALLHRDVEERALVAVRGEPGPEVGPVELWPHRLARGVQRAGGLVPDTAEEVRERGPAAPEELCGDLGVPKDTRFLLGEDAVARERAQQPVERVRVGAALFGELGHGARAAGELLRDAQVGDDPERARDECTAKRVPEVGLGRAVAHPRAVVTAAATSSASASLSVRQSSRSRPSRTTPTTGGSPARSGAASSSSTAHAKLGSSASGSAPPPMRPTVSSTSPPVSSASRTARPRTAVRVLEGHAQDGHLAERPLRLQVERERPFERCERELVGANSPLERVAPQPLDELCVPDHDPGLRPAEELVAREADEIRAGLEALTNRGLFT